MKQQKIGSDLVHTSIGKCNANLEGENWSDT